MNDSPEISNLKSQISDGKSGARRPAGPFIWPASAPRLLLALLLALVLVVWWQAWQSLQQTLTVTFLNVGEGDCIIIHSPFGRTLLIDGGSREDEVGREVIIPALYREGIGRLDGIIATHPHDDHISGLDEVVEQVPAGMLLDSGQAHPTASYAGLLEEAKKRNLPLFRARPGQVFNLGGGVRVEVLHPNPPFLQNTEDDLNNNSVTLQLTFGEVSFLLPGDLQKEGEETLLADYPNVSSTVLKVAHHGSLDSTSQEFLEAVRPKWAVISVGQENPFAHPHPQALARLKATGARVFRTDIMGTIVMRTDGHSLEAEWSEKDRPKRATLE